MNEIEELRAEILGLRKRVEKLEKKQRRSRGQDDSTRCPYADIPGERACSNHRGDGCGGRIPEPRRGR